MPRIRHKSTDVELDVPDEAVPYFPDYKVVKDEPAEDTSRSRKAAEPTTTKE